MLKKLVSKLKSEKNKQNIESISSYSYNKEEDLLINNDSKISQKLSNENTKNIISFEEILLKSPGFIPCESLANFQIPNIETVYYIPNYISQEDENYFLQEIYKQPKERWTCLPYAKRRLQKWGGDVTKNGLENKEPLPNWLEKLSEKLYEDNLTLKKTNHVLLNEYEPGSGIMPHTDGPLYHPYVVILSMNSHCVFKFYKDYSNYKNEDPLCKLLIEPRSLLIFCGAAYHEYLHFIEDQKEDIVDIVYVKAETDMNDINIMGSNIDNLKLTSLLQEVKEQASQSQQESSTKENIFSKRILRDKRISLTIRYIPEASI